MNRQEPKYRGLFERPRGSGIWWIRWHDAEGRRHREKVGSKGMAIKLVEKRRVQVREHKKLPELRPRVITFGEIAADALEHSKKFNRSHDTVRGRVARLLEWWKDRPADSIPAKEIEVKLASVTAWTDSTCNHYRATLSKIYKLAIRNEKLQANPVTRVPRLPDRTVRQGFINDDQYSKLAANCSDLWLRTMLACAYNFGWRAGELTDLKVRQVDLKARTLYLEPGTTKNSEGRTILLNNECLQLVAACISDKGPDTPVFTRESGKPVRAYRFDWERLCVKAGFGHFVCKNCRSYGKPTSAAGRPCPDCRKMGQSGVYRYEGLLFHDLRRSAVRNLERGNIPRSIAMKITGHKTESIYRRYAIVSESDMALAIEKLERMRLKAKNQGAPEGAPGQNSGLATPEKVM